MVVTCPECGTRFELDESLIRGESAKGRCSRCGHIFVIRRPAGGPPEEEPAPEPLPGPPPPEPELPEEPEAAFASVPEAPIPVPEPEEAPGPPAPPAAPRRRAWIPALLLLVAAGAGLAAWRLVPFLLQGGAGAPKAAAPAVTELKMPAPPPSLAELREIRIEVGEANFGRLVHPQAGRLLVLTGEVVNQGDKARGPVKLKAALLDARHREVAQRLGYAGVTLSEKELLTLAPAEIDQRLQAPPGREAILRPAERRPFTLVFFGVPLDLAEAGYGFTLAVVEAPPAFHP
jgi:predicted Zn finger-like uncharacterized protein